MPYQQPTLLQGDDPARFDPDPLDVFLASNIPASEFDFKTGTIKQKPVDPYDVFLDSDIPAEDFDFNTGTIKRKGFLDAGIIGLKQTYRSLLSAAHTLMGDTESVEEQARQTRLIGQTRSQRAFQKELWRRAEHEGDDTLLDGIQNVVAAAAEHPRGAFHETIAQAPNSVPALAGMYAGGKTGAALGSFAGPVGAAIGMVVGGVIGRYLGTAAIETGHIAMGKTWDAEGFTEDDRAEALRQGAIKAGVITAIDTATMGLNRSIMGAPGRAVEKRIVETLTEKGVDLADDAAVRAALKSPDVLAAALQAGGKAMSESTRLGRRVGRGAAAFALETFGEGAGEYLGSQAAGLDASFTEAALESLLSVPQSAVDMYVSSRLTSDGKLKRQAEQTAIELGMDIESVMGAGTVEEAIDIAKGNTDKSMDDIESRFEGFGLEDEVNAPEQEAQAPAQGSVTTPVMPTPYTPPDEYEIETRIRQQEAESLNRAEQDYQDREAAEKVNQRAQAARKRNQIESRINPQKDDILAAIAKAGGLNREQAEAHGIDPAEFNRLGWRIKRVFTKKGDTFDGMARTLVQYGYPVTDEQRNYDANILLNAVDDALRGRRIVSVSGHNAQVEQEVAARMEAEAEMYQSGSDIEQYFEDNDYTETEAMDEPVEFDVSSLVDETGLPEDRIEALLERSAIQGLSYDDTRRRINEATRSGIYQPPQYRQGEDAPSGLHAGTDSRPLYPGIEPETAQQGIGTQAGATQPRNTGQRSIEETDERHIQDTGLQDSEAQPDLTAQDLTGDENRRIRETPAREPQTSLTPEGQAFVKRHRFLTIEADAIPKLQAQYVQAAARGRPVTPIRIIGENEDAGRVGTPLSYVNAFDPATETTFEAVAVAFPQGDIRLFRPHETIPVDTRPQPQFASVTGDATDRGLTRAQVEETIAKSVGEINENTGLTVRVVDRQSELPPEILAHIGPGEARQGVFHNNTAYLIAEHIPTERDAHAVLAHEVIGHFGIEQVLGDKWDGMVRQIKLLKTSTSKEFQSIVQEVAERYGELDEQSEAAEILAVAAERHVREGRMAGLLRKVRAAVYRFLRALGLKRMLPDAQLDDLIYSAGRYVRTGERDASTQKSPDLQTTFRLQLPWVGPANQGSRRKILTDRDIVNQDEKPRFSQNNSIVSASIKFAQQVIDYLAGRLKTKDVLTLGQTPIVLQQVGASSLELTMDQSTVKKAITGFTKHGSERHPPISQNAIKQLVLQLNDPIAIFDSKTKDGAYVVLTELQDDSGASVVVAVHTDISKANNIGKVNKITSVYGKDSAKAIQSWIDSDLRYVNTKKAPRLTNLIGVQFPEGSALKAHRNNILTEQDIVKQKGKPYLSVDLTEDSDHPGMTQAAAQSALEPAIQEIQSRYRSKIHVVANTEELPFDVEPGTRPKGVYQDGEIYLVAGNLRNKRDAQVTLAHELIGHMGIEEMMTVKEWQDLRADISSLADKGEIKELADEVMQRYGELDENTRAAEILAIAAEKRMEEGPVAAVLRRARELMRAFLKQLGLKLPFSVTEIDTLLSRSLHRVQSEDTTDTGIGERDFWTIKPTDDEATVAWKFMAQDDEMFEYPISSKRALEDIAAEVNAKIQIRPITASMLKTLPLPKDIVAGWEITMPDGSDAVLMETKNGLLELNVASLRVGGSRGTALYHIVANYAYNNDKVFVGDSAGLSDVALYRRTENMLSSALKFGTTRHLYPHERQMTEGPRPMNWKVGDDDYNLQELIRTSYENTKFMVPEIRNFVYNFRNNRFENIHTGEPVSDEEFRQLAERINQRINVLSPSESVGNRYRQSPADAGLGEEGTRFGSRTSKRAILTHTFLQEAGGDGRKRGQGLLGGDGQQLHPGRFLKQLLYARDESPARISSKPLYSLGDESDLNHKKTVEDAAEGIAKATEQPAREAKKGLKDRALGIADWLDEKLNPLAGLEGKTEYLTKRYLTLGKIAKSQEAAKMIHDMFDNLNDATSKQVYDFLVDRENDGSAISDKRLRLRAIQIKKKIDEVGRTLVGHGIIPQESFEKYRGQYLPRVYLAYLLGDKAVAAVGSGKTLSGMGYAKKRKDLDQVTREVILGEIKDPAFLASRAIGLPLRDLAIMDWLAGIAKNPDWALPKQLIEWQIPSTDKKRKVTPYWLKSEASKLRQRAEHYDIEKNKQAALAIANEMDTRADKALAELGITGNEIPEGYAQIPQTAKYGAMRGLVVKKQVYDDIVSAARILGDEAGIAEKILGYGGIGTKITQVWKVLKVPLNPPAQVRNLVSNFVLMHLSGVPLHRLPGLVIRSAREIRTKGKYHQIGQKFGLTESTFTANELLKIERETTRLLAKQGGRFSLLQLKSLAEALIELASGVYQKAEMLGKLSKIMYEMEENGKTEAEAVLEAQKWLFDYSLVGKNVRFLRNAPIGVPFITFYIKVLPLLLETAIERPMRFLPYIALTYGATMVAASLSGADYDDMEKLEKATPEWLQKRGHVMVLPVKDEHGRWQFVDIGYFLPWSMWTGLAASIGKNVKRIATGEETDSLGELMLDTGILGGPIPDMMAAMMTNRDNFTGKEIVNKNLPAREQWMQRLTWLYGMAMPSWLVGIPPFHQYSTYRGAAGHLYEAVTGAVDRYGNPRSTVPQALARFVGINIYPVEPEVTRTRNLKYRQYEIDKAKYEYKRIGKDRSLSPDERERLREGISKDIERMKRQYNRYKEESEVPAHLL